MNDTGPVPITGVTGGSEGLAATYARVLGLAAQFDTAGNRMRDWAGLGARTLGNGDLLESAVLSPVSFAEAEGAVLAATTGPDGVLVESIGWETDAVLIRVTVWAFQETDRLVHGTFEVLDYLVGRSLGLALGTGVLLGGPVLLAGGLAVGPRAYAVWHLLPADVQQQVRDRAAATGAGLGDGLQEWLNQHPETVQHLVNGGGGLLDGLWDGLTPLVPLGPLGIPGLTPDTESAAGVLAGLYGPDGAWSVQHTDLGTDLGGTQPGSLADVLHHLDETNQLSDDRHPEGNGTIEIQTIDDGHGGVRHIVYLPGTDDMTTLPWTQDGDVRDLATNFLLIHGQDNAYQQGILEAMHAAGIRPGDPVLLAGHSQGGMEAAHLLSHGSDFNVTNVITAGSPTAQVPGFPPGSHVLSFENQGDVVPLMDGEDNPDSPQQVTVRFDDHEASVGENHGLPHYVNGAAAADASTDPSILEQVHDLQAHGFLASGAPAGTTVSSQVFQVTRLP